MYASGSTTFQLVLLALLLLVPPAVLIIRWTILHRPAEGHEGCGHCGYLVTGLPSPICPECGSDLQVVGVRGPHPWMRLLPSTRRNILLVLWTLWSAGAAILLWPLLGFHLAPCLVMESVSNFLAPAQGNLRIEYAIGSRGYFWPWEDYWFDDESGWCLRIHHQPTTAPSPAEQILALDGGPIGSPTEKRFCVDLERSLYAFDDPAGTVRIQKQGPWEQDFVAWMGQLAKQYNCPGLVTDMRLSRRWTCMGDFPYRMGELPTDMPSEPSPSIKVSWPVAMNTYQHTDWRLLGSELLITLALWATGVQHIVRNSRRGQTPR